MRALILTLSLIGCSPSGSVSVESGGSNVDDTNDGDTNVGDTNDTNDTNDTTDTNDTKDTKDTTDPFEVYAGEYEGGMYVMMASEWFDYELEDCEAWIDISDDGELDGEATCSYGGGGWGADAWGGGGGDSEIPLYITGEVDEDGEISGLVEMDMDIGVDIDPMDMSGETDGEELAFEFDGDIITDWFSATIIGDAEMGR